MLILVVVIAVMMTVSTTVPIPLVLQSIQTYRGWILFHGKEMVSKIECYKF